MRATSIGMCALLLVIGLGCGERDERFETPPQIVAVAPLGDELLFIDRESSTAHAVKVLASKPRAAAVRLPLPTGPSLAANRAGQTELLVLGEGKRDEFGERVDAPALAVLKPGRVDRRYEFDVPYAKVSQSPEGHYAVLWEVPPDAQEAELLTDTNRVALVDLEHKPSEANPSNRSLRSLGGPLQGVFVTPPMNVAGRTRSLALFTFPKGLSIWDLTTPSRSEITAELSNLAGNLVVSDIEVDTEAGKLYYAAQGSTDAYVLSFGPSKGDTENDFAPSFNQLQLGSAPASDLILFGETEEQRVLAATGSAIVIVDADSSRLVPVALRHRAETILGFEGKSPRQNEIRPRALVYAAGASSVSFVDLDDVETTTTRAVETLDLGYLVASVTPLNQGRALVTFSDTAVGVLDLESRRFQPIGTTQPSLAMTVEPEGVRVWTGAQGDNRLGTFDSQTLQMDSIALDLPIQSFFLFGAEKKRRVVVTHQSSIGALTVVDANSLSRQNCRMLEGFLLDGWVDR